MADFNYYLNRQGLTGHKGDKGDQGFAPYFTVETSTANVYKLRVHNENDSFVTDNLRGNAINIVNPDGTYIKYDKLTGDFYVDTADIASTDIVGQVRLATLQDVEVLSNDTAITPELLADTLPIYLVNTDGNISIAQRDEDSKTVINLSDSFNEHLSQDFVTINTDQTITGIEYIDGLRTTHNYGYISTGNFGHDANWTVRLRNTSSNPDYPVIDGILNTNAQDIVVNSSTGKVELNSNIKNNLNNVIADLATERTVRGAADSQLQALIDAERGERETQDSALQAALNNKLTVDNITSSSDNITLRKSGNNIYIGTQDLVTINDTQTITGRKTFDKEVKITSGSIGGNSNYLSIKSDTDKEVHIDDLIINKDSVSGDMILSNIDINKDIIAGTLGHGGLAYRDFNYEKSYYTKPEYLHSSDGSVDIKVSNQGTYIDLKAKGGGGGGGAIIDDEDVSISKVFSSSKTSELVGEVGNDLQHLTRRVNNIESLKVPNVVIVGEPTIQEGQVSNMDENNHLQLPFVLDREGRNWECDLSFTTGNDVTTQQNIIDSRCSIALAVRNSDLVLALSTDGNTFNLGEHIMPDFLLQPNTTYYVRISYISNMGYVLEADVNPITYGSPHLSIGYPNLPIAAKTLLIGSDGNSFSGTLDLNKWSLKLNNELIWLGMDNVGQAVSANVSLSNINENAKDVIRISVTDFTNTFNNTQFFAGGICVYDEHKAAYGSLVRFKNNSITIGKDGTNTVTDRFEMGNPTAGNFYKYKSEISFVGGFHFIDWLSPIPSLDDIIDGEGIELTKDNSTGQITISCPAIGDINSILDAINGEVI